MNLRKIPLAAFLIPVCLLLFSFRLVVFDEGFYKSEFEKYDVYDDVEKESADSALKSLVDYMKDGKPLSDFFNEKEKAHMVDVRNIIQKLLLVFYITLLILIVLFLTRGKALRSLFYGGVFTLALLLIFFIASYAWFDTIFYQFHVLSFDNTLWQLNPAVDKLKALMPEGLFYDALARIFLISGVVSSAFVIVGFYGRKVLNILK